VRSDAQAPDAQREPTAMAYLWRDIEASRRPGASRLWLSLPPSAEVATRQDARRRFSGKPPNSAAWATTPPGRCGLHQLASPSWR